MSTVSILRPLVLSAVVTAAAFTLPGGVSAQTAQPQTSPGAQTAGTAKLPETPAGKAMKALVETVQQTDTAVIRKFVESHMDDGFKEIPMSDHIETFGMMRGDLAGTTLAKVDSHSDTHLAVTYRSDKGGLMIEIKVDPKTPALISGINIGKVN